MKNLKKQLRKEAENNTPDLYGKIMKQADGAGLFDGDNTIPVGGGAAAVRKGVMPAVYTACAFLLALAITLGIVLPLTLKKTNLPVFNPVELSVDDFYGAGALSSVKLLEGGVQSVKSRVAKENSESVMDQIDYFNKYLTAFDAYLGENFIDTVAADNENPQYAQYEKSITINTTGLDGKSSSYVMYYNETLAEDKGDEKNYILNGVMTVGGGEYLLYGERSVETDDDESEEEMKIRAYTSDTPEDYVEMKQEVSVEDGERETEYVYRIYSDNKLIEETSVEFETETKNGKTETEFELEFRKGESKGKYKVEREVKNGVIEISVKYNLNGESGKFKIKEILKDGENYLEYTFENKSTEYIKK